MSLASSTEDLILACKQDEDSENENSDDDLPLANIYKSNRQSSSNENQPIDDQLPDELPDPISQSCGDGDKLSYQLKSAPPPDSSFQNGDDKKKADYIIGDHVIVRWGSSNYLGQITSEHAEGVMVNCMKQGKNFWRWPLIKDEQLYSWENVLQKIEIPKFVKKGCFTIPELDK